MHAVAAAGLLASGLPLPIRLAGLGAVLLHALLRRPPRVPATLTLRVDGDWELGGFGAARFVLEEGTAAGPFWVLLELGPAASAGGPDGARGGPAASVRILLLRDQLPDAEWRALSAAVGRVRPARGGVRRQPGGFLLE
ncbi:MAG: hypothetical protein JXB36_08095 [Gammaproteobacteria bacterium]|nr:hypothetical protein [Gammaproteobacteria bacterium]